MFERFAPDEDMQLYGRGVRRRLPPMLGGDERRLRMAYSLMFSLPGTPVLFYGEEIGMGENPDIDGPLWPSARRCSGRTTLSRVLGRADGRALPAGDRRPGFGPEQVNVSAQRRDPESLLNWFERLIRRRRESPAARLRPLHLLRPATPPCSRTAATGTAATIVAVHNLARRAARAELSLEPGDDLHDLFGDRDATVGDDGRAVLDLEPHDHRWYAVGEGTGGMDVLPALHRPGAEAN